MRNEMIKFIVSWGYGFVALPITIGTVVLGFNGLLGFWGLPDRFGLDKGDVLRGGFLFIGIAVLGFVALSQWLDG